MGTNVVGVGYEGLDAEGFLSRLRIQGVGTVVDVRLNAISRKRGMSKNALRNLLAENGIGYLHLPELGNPRDNRDGFADSGPAGRAARERFEHLLETPQSQDGLDRVVGLAHEGKVALLCFEADERHCHREVILEAVRDREPANV